MVGARLGAGLLAAAAFLGFGLLAAPSACACSCARVVEAEQAATSAAVFAGRVVDRIEPKVALRSSADPVTIVFEVTEVYKGEVSRRQGVRTAASGASCGMEVEPGQTYLVFADRAGTQLTSSLCQTAAAPGAAARPGLPTATPLAAARPPVPGEAGVPGGWSPAVAVAGTAGAVALLGIGGLAWRRRARRGRSESVRPNLSIGG